MKNRGGTNGGRNGGGIPGGIVGGGGGGVHGGGGGGVHGGGIDGILDPGDREVIEGIDDLGEPEGREVILDPTTDKSGDLNGMDLSEGKEYSKLREISVLYSEYPSLNIMLGLIDRPGVDDVSEEISLLPTELKTLLISYRDGYEDTRLEGNKERSLTTLE